MRQIRFTKHGANSLFGGFAAGDMARVSDSLAQHFVEIDVAAYVEAPAAPKSEPQRKLPTRRFKK